jgi:hypothetical protein
MEKRQKFNLSALTVAYCFPFWVIHLHTGAASGR